MYSCKELCRVLNGFNERLHYLRSKVYVYFMVSPAKVKRQYRLCVCVCVCVLTTQIKLENLSLNYACEKTCKWQFRQQNTSVLNVF